MFVVCFLLVSSVFGGLWEVELSFWNFVLVGGILDISHERHFD